MPDHAGHGASGKLTAPIGVAALAGRYRSTARSSGYRACRSGWPFTGGHDRAGACAPRPRTYRPTGRREQPSTRQATPVFHALAEGLGDDFRAPRWSGPTVGTKLAVACLSRVPVDTGGFADLSSLAWHSGDGRWRLARPCCARHRRVRRHRTHRLARHADAFHGRQPRWDVPARDQPSHGRARATGPLRRNRRRRTHLQRRFSGSVFSPTAEISG